MLLVTALAWLSPAYAADLHIQVMGARSAGGHIAIALFAAPGAGFPFDDSLAVRRVRVPVDEASGLCATTIQDLPEGGMSLPSTMTSTTVARLKPACWADPRNPTGIPTTPSPRCAPHASKKPASNYPGMERRLPSSCSNMVPQAPWPL